MVDPSDADTWQAPDSTARASGRAAPLHAAATVVFHPDPSRVGDRALLLAQESGQPLRLSRTELELGSPSEPDRAPRPLDDPFLSRAAIEISASRSGLDLMIPERLTVTLMGRPRTGAVRVEPEELERGLLLTLGKRVTLLLHQTVVGPRPEAHGLTGESAALDGVRRAITRVADLDVPVLILGETGAGKERVAQAIHRASGRKGPCVVVNVATLSSNLAASELFGHEKGAFTGAERPRVGLFTRADGGTLFLDEIGELPADVQPMLLRALDTSEVRPVGAKDPVSVDARMIAATDADLEAAVEEGRLRSALYHRLRGFEIRVPPLRERRADIPRLVTTLLGELLERTGETDRLMARAPDAPPWIDRGLLARLVEHDWPGNVRQLRSVLRQVVVASRGEPTLRPDPAVERVLGAARPREAEGEAAVDPGQLRAVLERNGWSFGKAARALGISRSRLYRMAEADPGIRTGGELSREELERAVRDHEGDVDAMVEALEVSRRAIKLRLSALGITFVPPK